MAEVFDYLPVNPGIGLPQDVRCDVFVLSNWPNELKQKLVIGVDPGIEHVGLAIVHYDDLLERRLEEGTVVGLGVLGWATSSELLANYSALIASKRLNLLFIWIEVLKALAKLGATIELVVIEEQPNLKGGGLVNLACQLCAQTLQVCTISRGLCCVARAVHSSKEQRCRGSPMHRLNLQSDRLLRRLYPEIQEHVLDASWMTCTCQPGGKFTERQQRELLGVRRLCETDDNCSKSRGARILDACLKFSCYQQQLASCADGSLTLQLFLSERLLETRRSLKKRAAQSRKRPKRAAPGTRKLSSS